MSHRILLIDDEDDILEFIRYNLTKAGYEVYTARNGAEGLQQAAAHRPHLILLDMMMPVMDGIETCRALRRDPALKETMVVFLSALGEEEQQLAGFGAGADDYIPKPFNPLELVARVKSQLRRYTQLGNAAESGDSIYTVGGLSINDDLKEVTVDGEVVKLTPIEYNILLLLVKNQGKVFSINQIYESIWNEDAIGADNTVAVHIRHIREKIEINPKEPRYLKVVWGVGYKIDKN